MEIKVISKEIIKPSSPTPPHLGKFTLSIFDQFVPLVYCPLLFFYSCRNDNLKIEDKLAKLKDSLSKTLTRFYPLAGRIKDQRTVDCNDEGVLYVVAQVNHEMYNFLEAPNSRTLTHLVIPYQPICEGPPELVPQLTIQVNLFACGGMAIGLCVLHKIIDAYTVTSFVKSWAALARGTCDHVDKEELVYDRNLVPSLFPPNERLVYDAQASFWSSTSMTDAEDPRRFVFDATAISSLKAKARSEQVPNPTRTEAVISFVWKSALKASRLLYSSQKQSVVFSAINLRSRLSPPLPDRSIGNVVLRGVAHYTTTTTAEMELQHLVGLLRQSVAKVDSDYINKLKGETGHEEFRKRREELAKIYSEIPPNFMFEASSALNMGFYEGNFGWGKPVWFGEASLSEKMNKNSILLVEAPNADDVEVWITLNKHQMGIVEKDPEFLSYATPNPPIISNKDPKI
ncbi:hypothetical protein K2173_014216 [Erythroxylum novogranatense]|uniref:Uncharacterized protein n=1 Tax=Erythroxylum novogranatense TaxID=1862640 RepID=A0AAV8SE66_9ROSI|nr:hypothetical protein K2173_014216 [Erythroxylum novogranatense]